MFNASQSGGGFMAGGNLSSPSVQGSGSGSKGKRAQNVVPVQISEVLNAPEEGFTVEGMEVGMVVILGRVTSVEKAATKTTYQVEDSTGEVHVIQWIDEGSSEKEHVEGTYVKVVGSIRTQASKKHIMAFRIMDIASKVEQDVHALEVVYSHLKLRQLSQKMGMGGGTADHSGLSNSMMGGAFGGHVMSTSTSTSSSFGNKNHDLVYGIIKQNNDEQGINTGLILTQLKGRISKTEMEQSIEFLSNEGHIYSTVDEDHFKSTEGD